MDPVCSRFCAMKWQIMVQVRRHDPPASYRLKRRNSSSLTGAHGPDRVRKPFYDTLGRFRWLTSRRAYHNLASVCQKAHVCSYRVPRARRCVRITQSTENRCKVCESTLGKVGELQRRQGWFERTITAGYDGRPKEFPRNGGLISASAVGAASLVCP